jgi:hypothetical protein
MGDGFEAVIHVDLWVVTPPGESIIGQQPDPKQQNYKFSFKTTGKKVRIDRQAPPKNRRLESKTVKTKQ